MRAETDESDPGHRRITQPPSTEIVCPVIHSPAFEHSSSTVPTRSSGGPDVFPGIVRGKGLAKRRVFRKAHVPALIVDQSWRNPVDVDAPAADSEARLHVEPVQAHTC